ncbi:MAG: hypothetical protein E7589_06335 [Ruminococcaceae bacterium]|nr:hypothetical protein [Oscillospiraceae bacterium]
MAENRFSSPAGCHKDCGKDTVCVETNRILDSCRDRDCFENVKVFLTDAGEDVISRTTQVRVKESCVAWTYIGIDPVQFNRGFYTVNIRFYIKLVFEGCVCGHTREFDGIAVLEKKVVLFGGESNVSIFKSSVDSSAFCSEPEPCYKERTVPCAVVEVVDPVILDVDVLEERAHPPICCCCCAGDVPESIQGCLSSPLYVEADNDGNGCERRILVVSIGLFSLVRLVRPAQYLINAAEFVIPDKECVPAEHNDPCAIFKNMPFPITEFAPPSPIAPCVQHSPDRNRCGC